MKRDKFAAFVAAFDFRGLFNNLGWDNFNETLPVEAGGQQFTLTGFAEKKGFPLFERRAEGIPERKIMQLVERKLCRTHANHVVIWTDSARTRQVWQIPVFEPNKPKRCVYPEWRKGQSPEALYQRFGGIAFSLEDEEVLTLFDVVAAVGESAKNAEAVTKKFYNEFTKQHEKFMTYISGIDDAKKDKDNTSKQWYASLMLNRLMFCYFIQKKGFLDGNKNYLKYKFDECQKFKGKSNFYNFYTSFLRELFHDALAKPQGQRKKNPVVPFGKIPYLNGGLFEIHSLEREYPKIDIADAAFAAIFAFFDAWNWHLDTRACATGRDINPDVIGYIFEKYINDRAAMGAYYTKEDITEYIGKNTIIPFLLDKVKDALPEMFEEGGGFWQYLQDSGDEYIYDAVKKGINHEPHEPHEWDHRITRIDANNIEDLSIPENIKIGLDTSAPELLERRKAWNTQTPPEFGLPTEIWRETIARWQRYFDLKAKIAGGKIHEISNLITYNLDIRRLVQDFLVQTGSPKFIRAFFKALAGDGQNYALTVLDPTCGSGAFLFAALNILEPLYEVCVDRMEAFIAEKPGSGDAKDFAQRLERLNIGSHTNRRYFIYKSIILNNLFGVDIMREAAETAKLRLFLKLVAVVDPDGRDANFGLEPLPDIDFNIKCGNTLVGFATEEEIRNAAKGELGFHEDALQELLRDCDTASAMYDHFQLLQMMVASPKDELVKPKETLRAQLKALNEKLDAYLVKIYEIDVTKKGGAAAWKASHQPFHWLAEFYQIIAKRGGFDVVIGNPPYVEYKGAGVRGPGYAIKGYATESCGNLYAFVVERALALSSNNARMSMIVPLSICCGNRMSVLRNTLSANFSEIVISNYEIFPSKLFAEAFQRLSIFIGKHDNSSSLVRYASKLHRWYTVERDVLMTNLRFTLVVVNEQLPLFAKYQSEIHETIIHKIVQFNCTINDHISTGNSKHLIFYQEATNYWMKASARVPFYKKNGVIGVPAHGRMLYFTDKQQCLSTLAVLNSSLFYVWYITFSDGFHLSDMLVKHFPITTDLLNSTALVDLGLKIETDISKNSTTTTRNTKVDKIEIESFRVNLSKPIIDEIDKVLAKHYGFTEEELDFIINYDIKYRMGGELEGREMANIPSAYFETTMFNYYFDDERDLHPAVVAFFETVGRGEWTGYTSEYTIGELLNAPEPKKSDMLALIDKYNIQRISGDERIEQLADAYITNKVIPQNKRFDALHIAAASVTGLDYILSLNFKHINKIKTKRLVEIINLNEGYKGIQICTPMEVITYEED